MSDDIKKEGQQTPEETKTSELSDKELDAVSGGSKASAAPARPKLHEAACKGTHLPEVVIEVW